MALIDNKHFVEAWEAVLMGEAELLDLSDPEDRASFRAAVGYATLGLKVGGIRELAKHYGAMKVPTSRTAAARALADAYIEVEKRRAAWRGGRGVE